MSIISEAFKLLNENDKPEKDTMLEKTDVDSRLVDLWDQVYCSLTDAGINDVNHDVPFKNSEKYPVRYVERGPENDFEDSIMILKTPTYKVPEDDAEAPDNFDFAKKVAEYYDLRSEEFDDRFIIYIPVNAPIDVDKLTSFGMSRYVNVDSVPALAMAESIFKKDTQKYDVWTTQDGETWCGAEGVDKKNADERIQEFNKKFAKEIEAGTHKIWMEPAGSGTNDKDDKQDKNTEAELNETTDVMKANQSQRPSAGEFDFSQRWDVFEHTVEGTKKVASGVTYSEADKARKRGCSGGWVTIEKTKTNEDTNGDKAEEALNETTNVMKAYQDKTNSPDFDFNQKYDVYERTIEGKKKIASGVGYSEMKKLRDAGVTGGAGWIVVEKSGENSEELDEGIFGIKTKKDIEKEEAAAKKAEEERLAQEKRDKEFKELQRAYDRADIDNQRYTWEKEKEARDAKRAYERDRYNSIKGNNPSNTGYTGINYSGGDYYSEDLDLEESVDTSMPVTFLDTAAVREYIENIPEITSTRPPQSFSVGYMRELKSEIPAKFRGGRGSEDLPLVRIFKCSEYSNVYTGAPYENLESTKQMRAETGKERSGEKTGFQMGTDNKIGISSTGAEQLQCYPTANCKTKVKYFLSLDDEDLREVSKEDIAEYLTPAVADRIIGNDNSEEQVNYKKPLRLKLSNIYKIGNLGRSVM